MDVSNPKPIEDGDNEQPSKHDKSLDPSVADPSAMSGTMDPQFHWMHDLMPQTDAPSSQEDAFDLDAYFLGIDCSGQDSTLYLEEWTGTQGRDACPMYEDLPAEKEKATAGLDMNNPDTLALYSKLLIFTEHSSIATSLEFLDCTLSRRNTLEILAARLGLAFSSDDTLGITTVCKQNVCTNKGLAIQADRDLFQQATEKPEVQLNPEDNPLCEDSPHPNNVKCGYGPSNPVDFYDQEPPLQDRTSLYGIFDASFPGSQISNPARRRNKLIDTVSEAIKTLEQFAACWRCRILHQKCDPGDPCRRCPSTQIKTSWELVGCRRGSLSDHMRPIVLCPNALISGPIGKAPATTQKLVDLLLDTMNGIYEESNTRLHQLLTSTGDTPRKVALDILCPRVNVLDFSSLNEVDAGDYVALQCNWILLEEPSTKDALNIRSVEELADLLNLATLFENEYGDTSLISTAVSCLRHCMNALCVHQAGVLTPYTHKGCEPGKCKLHCLDSLHVSIKTYAEALSQVILQEVTAQRDKRWWLSIFYSLCIQSRVRHGLKVIETQLSTPTKSSSAAVTASEYLQLAVGLFSAASSGYDPIALDWDLDDAPLALRADLRMLRYYRQARKVLKAMNGADGDVGNSYASLSRAFEIDDNGMENQPDASPLSGTKRSANSPPSNVVGDYDVDAFDPEDFGSRPFMESRKPPVLIPPRPSARRTKMLHASDNIVPPPLPPPRYLDTLGSLAKTPRRSRNSSPASRTSMEYSQSPRAIIRNISNDSLCGLPDSMNKWSLASHGSRSPASTYSSDHFLASGSTPTYPAQSPTMAMSIPSTRRFSGASASSPFPVLQPRCLTTSEEPKIGVFYTCECCPKRPKKFDTMEESSSHEAQKQYECSYCGNRFKNKSEAERHQNSVHTRRHSWSCSALLVSGYNRAFHESTDRPTKADTCGYCGEEFTRSGIHRPSDKSGFHIATDKDWDERLEHLQAIHNFRACNSSKKFFRADHFRQHLKHSHAGTSGKWTNALENACRVEEEIAAAPTKPAQLAQQATK